MKSNMFLITAVVGVVLVSISGVLLVVKNVSGFDMFGSTKYDCVPYNVFVQKGTKDFSVDISWSTKQKCFGFVQYGTDAEDISMIAVDGTSEYKAKRHIVTIEKIASSERYYFLINSENKTYGNGGVPLEFTLSSL